MASIISVGSAGFNLIKFDDLIAKKKEIKFVFFLLDDFDIFLFIF